MSITVAFWAVSLTALSAASMLCFSTGSTAAISSVPVWPYGTDPDKTSPAPNGPPDTTLKRVPGSGLQFTEAQIQNPFGPADWFPEDHPAMPAIVAVGRKPSIMACAFCHYPNGKGKPENAGVSGLPVSYFVEQMHEFRDGERKSADSRKQNTALMAAFAKAMTDQEIQQAAEYFGSIMWTPWIKVVETDMVPKTRTSAGLYIPIPGAGKEQLGERIIEIPVDPDGTEELRNPRSSFIAYVPFGSIEKGRALVTGGNKRTIACGVCHGDDLKGLGPVPGIAGRSPSYMARQLYDMQQGTRNGSWTKLMKPVVRNLSEEDVLNVVAYVSSVQPQ
ncbi:MAG: c-type cytochrome [Acidobacteriaceae bacterium]|nr:c-type cytochrome [Acidobacteriaceae bacterium]